MEKSQELANFEQVVEKIIFNDDELEELKIAIRNFTEGKTSEKEFKHLLLQCRGRMVEEITDFGFFFAEKRTENLIQTIRNKKQFSPSTKIESQLREEIIEKNELLETVAERVNQLVSKFNNEDSRKDQKQISSDEIKEEIEQSLYQIGAKEWIEMCYYDDYKFFVKLYPKLEALYKERFGESEKISNNTKDRKEIMANKMLKLGFPKEIETLVVQYISIRNNFQHSMNDISPSHLELTHEAFVKLFVYLILNSLEPKFLLNNRESLYSYLTDFFSNRLTSNPVFRKKILGRLKTVFYS
jgi:hypothetical protein